MISFSCDNCGKAFSVSEEYAGRRARCKACGATVTVPLPDDAFENPAPPPPASANAPAAGGATPKVPMRLRRLRADAAEMSTAFAGPASLIHVTGTEGEPPEVYRLSYAVKSLERGANGEPTPRETHEVEIRLTSEYPRQSPHCKMLTPIFHPNIDASSICVGDHWTAGERLADLAVRIGEMIAYQAYNIKSPLDGEAAMWADLHQGELPIDSRPMRGGSGE